MEDLDEQRWSAVLRRDASFDGHFVYAVASTGVVCRPGCASRAPRRENVEFFVALRDAEIAGYRACRRCRPDQDAPRDAALDAVITLCRRLEDDTTTDLASFAAEVGYSERHLRRRFSEVTGVTVGAYARTILAQRARESLPTSTAVTDVVYESGFGSNRAFYEHGAPRLGMTPRNYRAGAEGERIALTSLLTSLGVVVVAATARGVCAIRIGEDPAQLEEEVAREFPHATLERDDEGLSHVVALVALVARGRGVATSLPLDLRGTAFQVRVWEELRGVARGTTLTYSELAERVGAPTAVRATGSACGANPVALVVPCHRVVRRDGSLGGYRWGLEVKQALLSAERECPSP